MYFETHSHLNSKEFDENLEFVLDRARQKGCMGFMVVGWDLESSRKATEIANTYSDSFASVGIHPENCLEAQKEDLAEIVELLGADIKKKIKAIGEIGLDYYWDKDEEHHRIQRNYFEKQIQLAENEGDMNQYRFLLNYQKKLTREKHRIKYGVHMSGRTIPEIKRRD